MHQASSSFPHRIISASSCVLILLAALAVMGCFGPLGPGADGGVQKKSAKTPPSPTATKNMTLAGIDALKAEGFSRLADRKLAILTHSAAVDAQGETTLDLLLKQPGVEIVRVYAPASGLYVANSASADSKTPETVKKGDASIPVVHLKTPLARPTGEQLEDVDLFVVDLQDTGVRFSPFVNHLAVVMEECYKAGVAVMVLDRPNPLGGLDASGPIQDPGLYGRGQSYYPMPLIHGMTLGEMARLYNDFFGIGAELDVVELQRWSRMYAWPKTGRPWTANIGGLNMVADALIYPAAALVEPGNVSIGRGTEKMAGVGVRGGSNSMYRVIGAPYIDGQALLEAMNASQSAKAYDFRSVEFRPTTGIFQGELCQGVGISLKGGDQAATADSRPGRENVEASPLELGLELLATLHRLYPNDFDADACYARLGSAAALRELKAGRSIADVVQAFDAPLTSFQTHRFPALIYRQ